MSTLEKPVKAGVYRRIHMNRLLPAYSKKDGEVHHYFVRYVDTNNKEKTLPCTAELFLKIHGDRKRKAPHTGLDLKIHTSFILHAKPGEHGEAVLIDQYPDRVYAHRILPADASEKTEVVLQIDPKGQIEVKDKPYQIRPERIARLMEAVDKLALLEAGLMVGDTLFEITSIQGRKVSLSYTGEDEAAVEPSADYAGM